MRTQKNFFSAKIPFCACIKFNFAVHIVKTITAMRQAVMKKIMCKQFADSLGANNFDFIFFSQFFSFLDLSSLIFFFGLCIQACLLACFVICRQIKSLLFAFSPTSFLQEQNCRVLRHHFVPCTSLETAAFFSRQTYLCQFLPFGKNEEVLYDTALETGR